MNDALGDRMKEYEGLEAARKFMPGIPIIARVDGRGFSKFTKGMGRPFDQLMTNAMIETTKFLVKETNACIGYTQSDEITLVFNPHAKKRAVWFNARITKMISQLAAQATIGFYNEILRTMPKYARRLPTFDARVWQVPTAIEAANSVLWREWDATKNSITMAASEFYSVSQLKGKNGAEKQELLFQNGINWNDYPVSFKRGTYVQRKFFSKPFTVEELEKLPEKHLARSNPELAIIRSKIDVIEMPKFSSVANPVEVIFNAAKPVLKKDVSLVDADGFKPDEVFGEIEVA
jgi:tRNA(His) 5'-end guanylyltransferase